jgi:hypothetical protein
MKSIFQTRTFWAALVTAVIAIARVWGVDDKAIETLNIVSGLLTAFFLRDAIEKNGVGSLTTENNEFGDGEP